MVIFNGLFQTVRLLKCFLHFDTSSLFISCPLSRPPLPPVSPSESVTKYPPPLLLKAMLVLLKSLPFFYKDSSPVLLKASPMLLKAMLVSLLLCLPHTLSYPYPLLLIELVHLLPCLLLPHVCSPVSSSTCPPPYSLLYVHIMSLCHYV